jgi:phosphoglycolate phosphatase
MSVLPEEHALIFDLDNTLVHSKIDFRGIRAALVEILTQAGAIQEPLATEGPTRRSIGEIIQLGEELDRRAGTDLSVQMWTVVEQFEREGMRLASVEPDASEALGELRSSGHAVGVLTNNSRVSALEALHEFGLLSYLDLVLGREDVPAMKPSPSGLLVARDRLGSRAAQLWMVGDSYLDGLAAARAGYPFVAFRAAIEDLQAHQIVPVAHIATLGEMLALLGR